MWYGLCYLPYRCGQGGGFVSCSPKYIIKKVICHIGIFKTITLHNILERLWCRWCCCEKVHPGLVPIIDWSIILSHCWCWLGTPLQASHTVSLAWLGLAWPRFKCRYKVPDLRVLVNQPRYTSQARIRQIAQKQYTQQHRILDHKLHSTRPVGLTSWLCFSVPGPG